MKDFNYRGVYTLFQKEMHRFLSVWTQTVIGPLITNVLYMMIFGVALSSRAAAFDGFNYLQILIPGLAAMGIMMNALQNPMSSLMIAKYTGSITDLLVIPLRGYEIVISYIAAAIVRGTAVGAVTIATGMIFVDITFANPAIIVLFTILLGAIFASLGVLIGIVMPDFDKSSMIMTFVLTPLLYLAGVFYSIQSLPEKFALVSKINPLFYLVDGFRYGFLGVGDVSIGLSLTVTVGIFLLTFGAASIMFQRGYKLMT